MRQVRTKQDFSMITRDEPVKSLVFRVPYKAGRAGGKISVRHKGSRTKRLFRAIDFSSEERLGIAGRVESIEYDPYRSSRIASVLYRDGKRVYILAYEGIKVGDEILADKRELSPKPGMRMPIGFIPAGTLVHNIQIHPGAQGRVVRSAGVSAQVLAPQGDFVEVKLPSSEVRLFHKDSLASIGQVSNPEHGVITWAKAGRMRKRGIRPTVRGVAMSAYAHPHGGGEGKTGEGRHPKTPWGKPARGVKTRKKHKYSNKFVVTKRVKKLKK